MLSRIAWVNHSHAVACYATLIRGFPQSGVDGLMELLFLNPEFSIARFALFSLPVEKLLQNQLRCG
jgi:hypothetical protein